MKGKQFELKIKNQYENKGYYSIRLRDVSTINGRKTKATKNISDFIFLKDNEILIVECKVTSNKSLTIPRQFEEMQKFRKFSNAKILIHCYFSSLPLIERNRIIDFEYFEEIILKTCKKSVNYIYFDNFK